MLLDSNIVIYAARPEHAFLRDFVEAEPIFVSAVSYIEVLGYHELRAQERLFLEQFFDAAEVLPISQAVVDEAVHLRQQRKMSLGDALVGATALVFGLRLVTRNVVDFDWIEGLALLNPFEAEG